MKAKKFFLVFLTSSAVVSLFLAAVYFFNESTFGINQIQLSETGKSFLGLPNVINFPFTLYRGWDVIAIIIYIILFLLSVRKKNGEYTEALISFPLGGTAGFIFGAISVIEASNLITGISLCLLSGIILSVIVGLIAKKDFGINFAAGFSLLSGLIFGLKNLLTIGVAIGLCISIALVIVIELCVFLTYVVKPVLKKNKEEEIELEEI